jgi:hypothetical protein
MLFMCVRLFVRLIRKSLFIVFSKDTFFMLFKFICTVYTGCPRRNVPDFGRVFLMLKYTDITQNTYIQS